MQACYCGSSAHDDAESCGRCELSTFEAIAYATADYLEDWGYAQ